MGFRFPMFSHWCTRRTSMVSRDGWLSIMWMIDLHWGSVLEASDLWQFWNFSQSLYLMVEVLEELVILFWTVASVCTGACNKGHPYWFLSCSVLFGDWKGFILWIGSYWRVLCCWHFTLNYLVCPSFFPPSLHPFLPSFPFLLPLKLAMSPAPFLIMRWLKKAGEESAQG